jgi:hypothetical protein
MSKIIFVFIITSLMSLSLFASEILPEMRSVANVSELKPHMGLAVGVGSPEGSLNSAGNYAVEVGYQPYVPVSFAGVLSIADYTGAGDIKLVRSSLLAKAAYNFGGQIPFIRYSYVSMGLGPMWEDTATKDQLALGFLPNLGFDYPLKNIMESPLTLGLNVSYLLTTSTNADVFAMNGVVKYWF